MLKKHMSKCFILIGIAFLSFAVGLVIFNAWENEHAGEDSQNALEEIQLQIINKKKANEDDNPKRPLEVDGYQYIGYLSIPALELDLPVMSDWDNTRLKIAPCRHFGSAEGKDLVIAGHNYKKHFAKLNTLAIGDTVFFTDEIGNLYEYHVQEIKKLIPTAVEEVQKSEWDLILYTCTYGGNTRLIVGCQMETVTFSNISE